MRSAVIVSVARPPIARAYRGEFNDTQSEALGCHAIAPADTRPASHADEVEDFVTGATFQIRAPRFDSAHHLFEVA